MEVGTRSGLKVRFNNGAWEFGKVHATSVVVSGRKVLGEQAGPIPDPSAGTVIDQQARLAIGQILGALRHHGLVA